MKEQFIKHSGNVLKACLAAAFAALLISGAAWGQSPPNAGRLLQEFEKTLPPQPPEKPSEQVPVPQEPPMKQLKEAKLYVKGFSFRMDFPVVPESELQQLLKVYKNREDTFAELQEAAAKITGYLRGKGYFLAKAYIPQQEIIEGIVRINVVIGKAEVGKAGKVVEVEGEIKRLKQSVIQGIMSETVKADAPLELDKLERGILLVNDLPGMAAATNLSAGSVPGTTKITVKVKEGPLITGSAGFDDFGERYTGRERILGSLNINDLSGYGDSITFSGLQAGEPVFNINKGKMWVWSAGWHVPIGYSGLQAGIAYTSLGYRIGEENSDLDSHGTAITYAANATYPIIRSRENNLYASISYDHKNLLDATAVSVIDDKRVNVVSMGFSGNMLDTFWGGGYTAYGLSATGGHLELGGNPDNLAADQLTLRTEGDYWKFNYNVDRQQSIGSGFSLYGALNGQYSGKNLDSSEQFILGGPTGVRAYGSGEAPGDDGLVTNMEIRKDFPGSTPLGHIQALTFFDYGWIVLHKDTWANWNSGNPALKNSYGLSGAGLGLNISMTAFYFIRAYWAVTLGPNPGLSAAGLDSEGRRHDNRFWVQSLVYF